MLKQAYSYIETNDECTIYNGDKPPSIKCNAYINNQSGLAMYSKNAINIDIGYWTKSMSIGSRVDNESFHQGQG